jgi:hypothetical protein
VGGTRCVQSVRRDGRDVSTLYGGEGGRGGVRIRRRRAEGRAHSWRGGPIQSAHKPPARRAGRARCGPDRAAVGGTHLRSRRARARREGARRSLGQVEGVSCQVRGSCSVGVRGLSLEGRDAHAGFGVGPAPASSPRQCRLPMPLAVAVAASEEGPNGAPGLCPMRAVQGVRAHAKRRGQPDIATARLARRAGRARARAGGGSAAGRGMALFVVEVLAHGGHDAHLVDHLGSRRTRRGRAFRPCRTGGSGRCVRTSRQGYRSLQDRVDAVGGCAGERGGGPHCESRATHSSLRPEVLAVRRADLRGALTSKAIKS